MNFSVLLEKLLGRSAKVSPRQDNVLASTGVGWWKLNLADGVLSACSDWFDALGWEGAKPSTELAWRKCVHPDEVERLVKARGEMLKKRTDSYEVLYRIRYSEEKPWRHILERGRVAEFNSDGIPQVLAGAWIDVTAQAEAEKRRKWPTQVFEESAEMLALLDMQCSVINANRAFRDRCGIVEGSGGVRGHLGDFFPKDVAQKVMRDGVGEVLSNGTWWGEAIMNDANGGTFFAALRLRMHRDEKGVPAFISLVVRDTSTERAALQARTAATRREYQERKLESLGLLAGGLAHEFNNLLTAVLGTSSLARSDLRNDPEAQAYFRQIEEVSFRAAEHCQVLHSFAGRGQIRSEPHDLNALADEWLLNHRNWIGNRARVVFTPSPQACVVNVDREMISACLRELVDNAIFASSGREPLILIRTGSGKDIDAGAFPVCLPLNPPVGEVRWLEVMDQGLGMPPETLDRLCEPFFTTKPGHTGLGLATVFGAIRSHGGVVLARGEVGVGSTVRIVLPCSSTVQSTPPFAEPPPGIWRGAGQILLVDDQETVRSVTTRLLENLGFTPLVAVDGAEAVRVFRQHGRSLHAVLLDMTMPGMDGVATFKELRRINAEVPVILMSGFTEAEMQDNFKDLDLAGVLRKPFTLEKLSSTLKQVLS